MRRTALLAAAFLLAPALAACGRDDEDTTLNVYAAASLTATFEEVAEVFEQEHDGVDVELNFSGSSDLVTSIQEGADADVFASADLPNMDKITTDGLEAGDPVDFATNTLQIVVPPGNPAGVTGFADLAGADVKLVVCAPEVPCGAATQKVSENTGITLSPVSEEQSVTDVLGKVTSGEADAGLVYVTDVIAAGDAVEGIEFPEAAEVVNTYPIVVLADSEEGDLAQEFVDLVLGEAGQGVLGDAGFAPAP
jgi:molybdate transport system substrate-binding protein